MKSKFLRKVTKAIAIPALTFLIMGAQLAPSIFKDCSNTEFTDLLNSLPSQILIVEAATNIEDTKGLEKLDDKNEYSSDYKYRYSGSDGKVYKTMYGLEKNKEIRQGLLDYLGTELIDRWGGNYHAAETSTKNIVRDNMNGIKDLLTSKKGRKELGQLASKHTDWVKSSWIASPELTIALSTGVVNSDYDVVNYQNSGKINRFEWYAMFGRYNDTNSNLARFEKVIAEGTGRAETLDNKLSKKNDKYKIYLLAYEDVGTKCISSFFNTRNPKDSFTEADMEKNVTKYEVMYTLGSRMTTDPYNTPSWNKGKRRSDAEMSKELIKAFEDITNANFDFSGDLGGKELISKKKLDSSGTAFIYNCYKLGVLIPDTDGNANLFKGITYSQALRYLFNDTIAWGTIGE